MKLRVKRVRNGIYLDNAATTALSAEVLDAMTECLREQAGNPSSVHGTGREAGRALDRARRKTANLLRCETREVVFTSGGSESDNLAIKGTAFAMRDRGRHLITSAIEHHAVLRTCRWLEKQGFEVTCLPVDGEGRVNPADVEKAIRKDTILISVMTANNEIGTIQPIAEIGRIARERGVLFHTDAVQAVGAMPLDLSALPVDLLSLSAHKFHGPKGTGALFVRDGTRIESLIHGGAQERGLRAGTENLAGIVGLSKALEKAGEGISERTGRIAALRDLLIRGVRERIPGAVLHGEKAPRLPGIAHFSFPGVDGEALLLRLDLAGIACSGGSACTSGSHEPSHVLEAIGSTPEEIRSGIRFSLGDTNTEVEIRRTLEILPDIVEDLGGCPGVL